MAVLIIASTEPGAGKTALAAGLVSRFASAGQKAGLAKAFATSDDDPDAAAFKLLVPDAPGSEPVLFSGDAPDDAAVKEAAERLGALAQGRDTVVVEGFGGASAQMSALADALDARVVLVVPFGGDPASEAGSYGDRLAGVVVNRVPRYRTRAFENGSGNPLDDPDVGYLGWMPEDRRLMAPSLRDLAADLGAEFAAAETHAHRLIDHVLIGGFLRDWAPHYYGTRENVGVLVRGDRPDLQLAALQVDTVQALILTKGIQPIEYVYHEAERTGKPVVVAPEDTHRTAAQLETAVARARFDHPDKLARCVELLEGRVDLAALDPALAAPATG